MSLGDFFEDIFGEDLVDLFGDIFNYFTEDETGQALTGLLGSYFLNQSGFGQPQIPQVGYQGGIPEYTGVRQRAPLATGIEYTDELGRPYVAPTGSGLGALAGEIMPQGGGSASPYTPTGRVLPLGYDPNRRPGSGGRRYFTDMQYVPTGGDMGEDVAPDQAALTQARAQADQQGLALLLGNLANLAREQRSGDPTNLMPTQAGPMPTGDDSMPPPDGGGDGGGPGTDPGFFPPPGGGGPGTDPGFFPPPGEGGPGTDPEFGTLADRDGYTGPTKGDPTKQAPRVADGNGIRDAAPYYWMVDGERFENRDAAIARARSLGDPGGLELFSGDGTLISGRPQYTAEEREEQRRLAEERRLAWEAQQERNRQRDAYWSGLIDEYGADEYQQTVNQDDYYTIDSPRLGQLKFASFQDAKSFLEKFNTGGDESITDVYDRSQLGGMPTSFSKIKSSGGDKTRYEIFGTPTRTGESFESRDEAANYLRPLIEAQRREQAGRDITGTLNKQLFNTYADTGEGFEELVKRFGERKANYMKTLLDPNIVERELNRALDSDEETDGVGPIRFRKRKFAEGGIANLAKGRYLNGSTDGMADQIPATIDGKQPAALSDGEFVIPADVVSHLGNGNSDAGAKVLEEMMARTRKERTGNSKQGKQINPRNVLPS
jgi:hypothetical protein